MPSYSPLPNIVLDPRTEAQLVQAAAQRVYEASAATLNDFSSGSPIMALLEGQAFAQAEFLQFANQFPESVLVEWIGPFLGAQRRTGSGAVVDITFVIDRRDEQFDVFPGYRLNTNPSLTGGESISFVTLDQLVIPAGESVGKVRAISTFRGVTANVEPNTITRSNTSLAGVVSVTNEEAAAGGQDPELLSEVKERFFSLIRRRNPVSAEDWQDFFSDALGVGTSVTVLPRRSERDTYRYGGPYANSLVFGQQTNYGGDYIRTNPSVAFFVLNPDGTPITSAQEGSLTNLVKWALPNEFLGFVYPMEVDDVDFVLGLEYDPAKPYAQNRLNFSEIVRNNLFQVMTPNVIFPVSYDQSVSDVEGALNGTFPSTLGVINQYVDPDIEYLRAYHSPVQISFSEFFGTSPTPFDPGFSVQKDDLVVVQGNVEQTFYPVLESFDPKLSDKSYYVNSGLLDLELIRALEPGQYEIGDVVTVETKGALHVVLASFTYRQAETPESLVASGYLSAEKAYTEWETDAEFDPIDDNGNYNPEIIKFVQGDTNYTNWFPTTPVETPVDRRPGSPIYVVNNAFTVAENTTALGTAQTLDLVAKKPTNVHLLLVGETYSSGEYVKTPVPAELSTTEITREDCYLDPVNGISEVYAEVVEGFIFNLPEDNRNYRKAFDTLVSQGVLKVIQAIPFLDCKATPTFADKPFRYQARFGIGEYVRYRPKGGFDAAELEECSQQSDECSSVSEPCKKLLALNLPLPRYFYCLKDFTPNTQNLDELIEQEVITEVESTAFVATYAITLESTVPLYPANITNELVATGQIRSASDLVSGDTVAVVNSVGKARGLFAWDSSIWVFQAPALPSFRDIFRFAPGDVASFRSVSEVRTYEATEHVTPMLDLEVYFDNGVFIRSEVGQTVSWVDPTYRMEDIIFQQKRGATSFYRAIRSFTPPETREVWNDATVFSTPRLEEIFGNLLKFNVLASCSDAILSRLKDHASTTKLGTCQIDLKSKSIGSKTDTFVLESTNYASEAPVVSYSTGTPFPYGPVDYGTGTLAL